MDPEGMCEDEGGGECGDMRVRGEALTATPIL